MGPGRIRLEPTALLGPSSQVPSSPRKQEAGYKYGFPSVVPPSPVCRTTPGNLMWYGENDVDYRVQFAGRWIEID